MDTNSIHQFVVTYFIQNDQRFHRFNWNYV